MNSYAWRTKYVQLPARIWGLKQAGYLIATRRNKNGSVDYLLAGEPDTRTIQQAPVALAWDFCTGSARQIRPGTCAICNPPTNHDASEPKQQSLF